MAAPPTSQLLPRGLSKCRHTSRGIHHNWTFLFSFQFSGLDTSDSVEPLEVAMDHPKPAATQCHGLCFPQARGPGLICIINVNLFEPVWGPEQCPQPHICHPWPGTLLQGDERDPSGDIFGCGEPSSALSWGSNVPAMDSSMYLQQIGEFPKVLYKLRFHESCSGWEYQSRGTMTILRIQDCTV